MVVVVVVVVKGREHQDNPSDRQSRIPSADRSRVVRQHPKNQKRERGVMCSEGGKSGGYDTCASVV